MKKALLVVILVLLTVQCCSVQPAEGYGASSWSSVPELVIHDGQYYMEWFNNGSYTGGTMLVWMMGVEQEWRVGCNTTHIVYVEGNTTPVWGAFAYIWPNGDLNATSFMVGDSGNTTAISSQPSWTPTGNLSTLFVDSLKVAWGIGLQPFYTGDPGLIETITDVLTDYFFTILVGISAVILGTAYTKVKTRKPEKPKAARLVTDKTTVDTLNDVEQLSFWNRLVNWFQGERI